MKNAFLASCFKLVSALLLATSFNLVFIASAQADVWGYVDEHGRAHFSLRQVDDRYVLFFASGEASSSERLLPTLTVAHPRTLFFEVSPDYKRVRPLMRQAAREYGIDFALLQALIATESAYDMEAVSPKGAVGLMQIMPATARLYGLTDDRRATVEKKLTDPRINIATGSRLLRDLIRRYPDRLDLVLAAYNAGEGAVTRAGNRVPNYKETINYVRTIMQLYAALKLPELVAEQRRARARPRAPVLVADGQPVLRPGDLVHTAYNPATDRQRHTD